MKKFFIIFLIIIKAMASLPEPGPFDEVVLRLVVILMFYTFVRHIFLLLTKDRTRYKIVLSILICAVSLFISISLTEFGFGVLSSFRIIKEAIGF